METPTRETGNTCPGTVSSLLDRLSPYLTGFGSDLLSETHTLSRSRCGGRSGWGASHRNRIQRVALPQREPHPHSGAYWLGGLASHGVLLGATIAVTSLALLYRKDLLAPFDAVVIPGSFLMGMGKIGNFMDGQIVDALTDVPWGVRFPGTDGSGIRWFSMTASGIFCWCLSSPVFRR